MRHLDTQELLDAGIIDADGNFAGESKTVEQGAATQVWAATSPQLAGMGGVYLDDCDIAEPAPAEDPRTGVRTRTGIRDYAIDPAEATRLWHLSADLTGENAFA
jgi:hypothetical protein